MTRHPILINSSLVNQLPWLKKYKIVLTNTIHHWIIFEVILNQFVRDLNSYKMPFSQIPTPLDQRYRVHRWPWRSFDGQNGILWDRCCGIPVAPWPRYFSPRGERPVIRFFDSHTYWIRFSISYSGPSYSAVGLSWGGWVANSFFIRSTFNLMIFSFSYIIYFNK